MSNELDLPLLPSADQIRRRQFATIRRGYDPDQVHDYLNQVATQVETLEKGLRDARIEAGTKSARSQMSPGEALAAQMAAAPSAPPSAPPAQIPAALTSPAQPQTTDDAYERLAKRFTGLIRSADEEATRILAQAKADAARITEEARSEADRIRVDAQARAEEARQQGSDTLVKAREEAERILGGLSQRRETLVSQMQDMQSRLLSVASDLEVAMKGRESASSASPAPAITEPPAPEPVTRTMSPFESRQASPEPRTLTTGETDDDIVDPRYEDLWTSPGKAVDIPDLAPIDLDFDDEARDKE
jgi:DivIVA domain-containing protein